MTITVDDLTTGTQENYSLSATPYEDSGKEYVSFYIAITSYRILFVPTSENKSPYAAFYSQADGSFTAGDAWAWMYANYDATYLMLETSTSNNYTYTINFGYRYIRYSIEFLRNAGVNEETSWMDNLYYATEYTLITNTFTRDGFTFVCWNTESDGSGTSYEDGATVSNLTTTDGATVTLYAQWEEVTDLTITKVSSEDLTALAGVEFRLYELICEDETHDDDLIDVTDYDTSCWELVGEYETDDEGELTLSDLPITRTYRLVETKTVEDYLLPTGQWKIEFDYDDNLDEDEAITVDGTTLQITAISNPPALSLVDDTLYLYNTPSYDLPSTGDLGISDFYKIGIPIALMGLIIYLAKLRKTYCTRKFSHLSRRHNRRR